MRTIYYFVWVFIILIANWAYGANTVPLKQIKVEAGPQYVKFIGSGENCEVIWRLGKKGAELSLQSLCQSTPLKDQIPVIEATFKQMLEDPEQPLTAKRYRTQLCCFQELDQRISLAAFQSALWDRHKGHVVDDDPQRTLTRVINESGAYLELSEMFQKHGFQMQALKTSRHRRVKAHQFAYFSWLKEKGVDENSILPADPVIQWELTQIR